MKITKRIKLTPEQFKYISDNRTTDSGILAAHLGLSFNSVTHNKYLAKKLDRPKTVKGFFDVGAYVTELKTI